MAQWLRLEALLVFYKREKSYVKKVLNDVHDVLFAGRGLAIRDGVNG
jgi:hypothetical protein